MVKKYELVLVFTCLVMYRRTDRQTDVHRGTGAHTHTLAKHTHTEVHYVIFSIYKAARYVDRWGEPEGIHPLPEI